MWESIKLALANNTVSTVVAAGLIAGCSYIYVKADEYQNSPYIYTHIEHFHAESNTSPFYIFIDDKPTTSFTSAHYDIVTIKNISTSTINDHKINLYTDAVSKGGNTGIKGYIGTSVSNHGSDVIVNFKNDGDNDYNKDLSSIVKSDFFQTGILRLNIEKLRPGSRFKISIITEKHTGTKIAQIDEKVTRYDCCADGAMPVFVYSGLLKTALWVSLAFIICLIFWVSHLRNVNKRRPRKSVSVSTGDK